MKSPKFRLRSQELARIITQGNIKTTWKNTVRDAMKRQYIEDPVEFLDINLNLSSVASNLTTRVVNGDYVPHAPLRLLSEKSKGLCRQIVVPHPYDALVLQCLSNNLFPALKASAPHKNAYYQPDRGFHTKIANKTGYSGLKAWLDFQERILEFSKTRPIVVVTDVANYYDTISYTQLRNILSNFIPDQKEALLDLTLHILGAMLWQPDFMPRVEVGLPQMDLDAPRLLAHTFLYELDKFVSTTKNADYARFMDDVDVGVDTVEEAKRILRDIDLTLHSRQVRLNAGKTKILIGPAIRQHFKVRENMGVNNLIARGNSNPTQIARTRRLTAYLIKRWVRVGRFDDGNGEKILKRLLNYAAGIHVLISRPVFRQILQRPGVREEALKYVSRVQNGDRYLPDIMNLVQSDLIIDDATALLFAYSLIEMRIRASVKVRKSIAVLALKMCDVGRSPAWIYAGLWILSKFGTERQVWDGISKTYPAWQSNYQLGRLIGGLKSVLIKRRTQLELLMRSSRNHGAAEVNEFLDSISLDPKKVNGIMNYLKAPNPSYPSRITHAKWIVLITVLQSSVVPLAIRQQLKSIHSSIFSDHHYALKTRAVT